MLSQYPKLTLETRFFIICPLAETWVSPAVINSSKMYLLCHVPTA